ncbi:MAG: leucine-rich repeat domain-containing protein [Clostridia bacterium]|nr:leucine-rich repeat domain-containing protein [Clostridia bacterium]
MKKRISLVLFLLLTVIMVFTFAACNQQTNKKELPDNVGGGNNGTGTSTLTPSLKFDFPIAPSSIFSSIFVEEFELERYVQYSVVYTDEHGATVRETPLGGVTKEMVDEADLKKLTTVGHHDIHVTTTHEGTVLKGLFELHLKDKSGAISLVNYTFDLRDKSDATKVATAYFGTTDGSKASVNVEKGAVIHSWSEFVNSFQMSMAGKALTSVSDGDITLSAKSEDNFPYTISKDTTFTTNWTDDVVSVTYDLNFPGEADVQSDKVDPRTYFEEGGEFYGKLSVARGIGVALQPEREKLDVLNGYYFAGWFNSATETLFDFNAFIGQSDVVLKAKWVAATYSFTLYTMGGEFFQNLKPSVDDNGQTITVDNAKELGYTVIESSSRFGFSDGKLNRVTFTGFNYGLNYDDYVAEVTISATGKKVMLKFSEIYTPNTKSSVFFKGESDSKYLVLDDLFTDYQCVTPLERINKVSTEQPVAYLRWKFDAPANDEAEYQSRISDWYTKLLFKDGISVKADGSLRIDKINDYSVHELIIPATLTFGGKERPVTEIGFNSCSNANALTKIDMSKATNLTTIGASAFAHDTHLTEVVFPTDNNIEDVGNNAFWDTKFENDYTYANYGASFIVINKMIYKYVGGDTDVIDLSKPEEYYVMANSMRMTPEQRAQFNAQLAAVETIVGGAFANCKSLVEFSLPAGVKEIKNDAFSGLSDLVIFNVPANSKLTAVGETAFDGSGIMTASAESNLYNPTYDAIFVGNVYYRQLNTSANAVTVPEKYTVGEGDDAITFTVKYIAANAFSGCNVLSDISFEKEENILGIGKDAFLDTKFIEEQDDAFTVVNGIMNAYFTTNATGENVVVPSTVEVISMNAFNTYARYFNTLQINSTVKRIEDYAFIGAHSLKSVIFTDIVKGVGKLDGAPVIDEYTFANSSGKMFSATLFFNAAVIDYFKALASGAESTDDAITRSWLNLYTMYPDSFQDEGISSIRIDERVVANLLLKTDKTKNAFTDKYCKIVDGNEELIENALIVTRKTGVNSTAPLGWLANNMSMELVPGTTNKYALKFKYNGSTDGCVDYIVTVYNAIQDANNAANNLKFYTSANYETDQTKSVSANGLNDMNSKYWFEGISGQVKDSTYPTFYTSYAGGQIKFVYLDINGKKETIDVSTPNDFNTRIAASAKETTLTVNFHGLGTYRFKFTYTVVIPKYVEMTQSEAVVIPVNGAAESYLDDFSINMKKEDGFVDSIRISANRFTFTSVDDAKINGISEVVTSVLGMHKLEIQYSGNDAASVLKLTLNYIIVAEADSNSFEYAIVNEKQRTARITRWKGEANPITIVVPSTCMIGDKEYTVVQIGDISETIQGVFENFRTLSAIYLPETIEKIGVNTFAGCTLLSGVYTASITDAEEISIPATEYDEASGKGYFEKVGREYTEVVDGTTWTIQPAVLKSLAIEGLVLGNTLVIGSDYVINANEHKKFRIIGIEKGLKLDVERGSIDVYLPDTIYQEVNIVDKNDVAITPIFVSSGSEYLFKTIDRVPDKLTVLAAGAFKNCISLKHLDLSGATGLEIIGTMAFFNSGLISVDLSKNTKLKQIENQTFQNNTKLESVKLPVYLEVIGLSAFDGCVLLSSVTGQDIYLKTISKMAFNRCFSLTRFELFTGITNIGSNAFASCGALTVYSRLAKSAAANWDASWNAECPVVWNCLTNDAAEDGCVYALINGIRYRLDFSDVNNKVATVVGQPFSLSGSIVIPESVSFTVQINGVNVPSTFKVTAIGDSAFAGNTKITSVKVTSTLTSIEAHAFDGCTALASFTFADSNGLENVSVSAFDGCTSLESKPKPGQME